jgi:hypothetical protein
VTTVLGTVPRSRRWLDLRASVPASRPVPTAPPAPSIVSPRLGRAFRRLAVLRASRPRAAKTPVAAFVTRIAPSGGRHSWSAARPAWPGFPAFRSPIRPVHAFAALTSQLLTVALQQPFAHQEPHRRSAVSERRTTEPRFRPAALLGRRAAALLHAALHLVAQIANPLLHRLEPPPQDLDPSLLRHAALRLLSLARLRASLDPNPLPLGAPRVLLFLGPHCARQDCAAECGRRTPPLAESMHVHSSFLVSKATAPLRRSPRRRCNSRVS